MIPSPFPRWSHRKRDTLPREIAVAAGNDEFRREFEVLAFDASLARAILDEPLQAWLMATADKRTFELAGNQAFVIGGGIGPQTLVKELDLAVEFVNRLPTSLVGTTYFPGFLPSRPATAIAPQWSPFDQDKKRGTGLANICLVLGFLSLALPFFYASAAQLTTGPAWLIVVPLGALVSGYAARKRLGYERVPRTEKRIAIGLALGWTFVLLIAVLFLYHASGCDKPGSDCNSGSGDGGGD